MNGSKKDDVREYVIHHKNITDSTNEDVKRLAEEGAPSGTVVTADSQRAGRGRRGRTWETAAEANIAMSLLLRPSFPCEKASMLTLVAANSIVTVLEKHLSNCKNEKQTGQSLIKWPNDIVINGKKVCGILTELHFGQDGEFFVIIGVGINVNQKQFSEDLLMTATSLSLETGAAFSREQLIKDILKQFQTDYRVFLETENLAGLKASYESRMVNKNRGVRVLDPKLPFEGIARGINEAGELLVEKKDGSIEPVYAGEVSVRGVYGYV